MKSTHFFSHDCNARNDRKLRNVLMYEGLSGIGAYWCIIEMLYEDGGYLMLSECERIAFDLHVKKEFIEDLLEKYGLFKKDEEKFWSESVLDRLKIINEKSEKARASAKLRWEDPRGTDANALRTDSEGNANKLNKSKVNNNIGDYSSIPIQERTVTQHLLVCFNDLGYIPAKDENEDSLREWITGIARLKLKTATEMIDIINSWHTYWKGNKKPVKNHKSSLLNNYAFK